MPNLFDIAAELPPEEVVELLATGEGVRIERIISTGQSMPPRDWYDQEQDEWVVLLQGEAVLTDANGESLRLRAGDFRFIPAHRRHRVDYTSANPPCIWLAIHATMAESLQQ
jgi:cupin 2 domain-containing protein